MFYNNDDECWQRLLKENVHFHILYIHIFIMMPHTYDFVATLHRVYATFNNLETETIIIINICLLNVYDDEAVAKCLSVIQSCGNLRNGLEK